MTASTDHQAAAPEALVAAALVVPGRARHGFFGRRGGVSGGFYGSLNCGIGSADERSLVLENRDRVALQLGAARSGVITAHQVHSNIAIAASRAFDADARPKADAIVTATPGLVIGVLTADCAPILFLDGEAGVAGCAHAGWRGALDGIIGSTVTAMERLGARRADIRAALGPCIGPRAYEVGSEFEATFVASDHRYSKYFRRPQGAPRSYFDLPAFVARPAR